MACKGNYFQEKIKEAQNDIIAYRSNNSETSLGYRFELWQASIQMFRDNPVLGVGTGGWEKELKKMIDQKKAPAFLQQFNQTHNIYLDALSTRGLIGLLSLLLLTCCPLLYIRKRRGPESDLFRNALIFITIAFYVSGLTDTLVRIRFVFMAYITVSGLGLSALIRQKESK